MLTIVTDTKYDPTREAAPSKEIAGKSESEPLMEEGTSRTMAFAARIAENWEQRKVRDGKVRWFYPGEPTAGRQYFDTAELCQAYIDEKYKMRVEQAKLTNQPRNTYEPQQILVTPKRTLADYIPPEYAHLAAASNAAREKVQLLGRMARKEASNGLTANILVGMQESNACLKVGYKAQLDNATKFIPLWVKIATAFALGLGTMIGWKRIVVTVGEKIGKSHLTYAQGASAELVAACTILLADQYHMPVSTTHVLSSGVAGTMAANHSGLQTETLRNLLLAWVLTLPVCVMLGAALFAGGLMVVLHNLLPVAAAVLMALAIIAIVVRLKLVAGKGPRSATANPGM